MIAMSAPLARQLPVTYSSFVENVEKPASSRLPETLVSEMTVYPPPRLQYIVPTTLANRDSLSSKIVVPVVKIAVSLLPGMPFPPPEFSQLLAASYTPLLPTHE